MPPSHALMCGTSHVLPPGYRSGLRCGTAATLAAGIGDGAIITPAMLRDRAVMK